MTKNEMFFKGISPNKTANRKAKEDILSLISSKPQIPKRKLAARPKVDNWNTSNVTSYLSNSRSMATLSKTEYKSRSTISQTSLSEVKRNPSKSYLSNTSLSAAKRTPSTTYLKKKKV